MGGRGGCKTVGHKWQAWHCVESPAPVPAAAPSSLHQLLQCWGSAIPSCCWCPASSRSARTVAGGCDACETQALANVCSAEVSPLPGLASSWRHVSVLVPSRGILLGCSLPAERGRASVTAAGDKGTTQRARTSARLPCWKLADELLLVSYGLVELEPSSLDVCLPPKPGSDAPSSPRRRTGLHRALTLAHLTPAPLLQCNPWLCCFSASAAS